MQNICNGMRPSMIFFDSNVSAPAKGGMSLSEIIKLCWHSDPVKRPSFSYLIGLLSVHSPETIRREVKIRRRVDDIDLDDLNVDDDDDDDDDGDEEKAEMGEFCD